MISTIRHQTILDPQKYGYTPITVIGAGATGSHLVMSLIELGFDNIRVYDFDKVEAHNLANQAYEKQDIGAYKVDALKRLVEAKLGGVPEDLQFIPEKVTAETKLNGVVFLLTDTMASRHEISNAVKENVHYVIETRMASSYGNVYGFYPSIELDAWRATLSDDETTEVSACGSSISVGPTAKITANLAVWQLIKFLTNPEAMEPCTNFFLSPLTFSTGAF